MPSTPRRRGQKKVGLDYERRVQDVLGAIYGERFLRSPVIRYRQNGAARRAIPDGLLYLDDSVIITEVKLSHTEDVWEQLIERYLPLVEILCPHHRVRAVEICRSYDPARSAIPHTLITSLHHKPHNGLEVLRWRI